MTFIDLFAGIGGFRLGMEMAEHKCLGFCEYDKFAVRSYRAMHNTEGEWYADDIRAVVPADMPRADCWCLGFPCQDISVAGNGAGLAGDRSGLFYAVVRLIEGTPEKDRPSLLLLENVKNLLSINRGFDFLAILSALDEIGYDAEWAVINFADVVPQSRERVYIVGHLRGRCTGQIFPIDQSDTIHNASRPAKKESSQIASCLTANGRSNLTGSYIVQRPKSGSMHSRGMEFRIDDIAYCLTGSPGGLKHCVAIPTLTPDWINKRQNGRRMKCDGDPMYTLTAQDRHGVYDGHIIRKLTPRECFRMQGWPDEYFDRAAAVNSDTQLYKQAGNGVTVTVVYEIAKRLTVNAPKA